MWKKNKNINTKPKHVIANLVATYDLSPPEAQSVLSIDYLCVYEYEYEGKKYKYRTHQKDTFSSIPEMIELGFTKDPNNAYKVNISSQGNENKSSVNIIFWSFIFIGLFILLFIIYNIIKYFNIIGILFIIGILIAIISKSNKKNNNHKKNKDEMLENAILNNNTAIAYLIKTKYISRFEDTELDSYYRGKNYETKYKYEYNGKKYTTSFYFGSRPPRVIKIFFGKNPKDIIHVTY